MRIINELLLIFRMSNEYTNFIIKMRNSKFCQIVRRNLMLFVVLMMAIAVNAVPAKPGLKRTLQLVDGTMVEALLVGDEYGHYWRGTDGKAYREDDATGFFQVVDEQAVKESAKVKRANANTRRIARLAPRKVGEVGNYTGKKKGLIILVNFSDTKFKKANTKELFQRVANESNFTYGNFVGSVHDYFYDQSDGKFDLTFDIVGPVNVSESYSYYGSNDEIGEDVYPATMITEAVKLANNEINYADYDWDNDGYVDQIYVIYAGKGAADGGGSDTIWPHEWDLASAQYWGYGGSGPLKLDGVWINTYACGQELDGVTGEIAGIGTMCHEFSHCLGFPDFYDTDSSGGQGMGYWDLMDGGSYNGNGYQPAGYTTYERWVAGWKTPIELTKSKSVTNMKALQDGGEGYIIYNGGNRNEYFILENRQKIGWDASLPGAGLLILHVDYNASSWANNTPNDTPSHQRMTWIPADNVYQYTTYQETKYFSFDGMATDTYPYGSNNAFNKSTTPAAKFYNMNTDGTYYMDSSIENITQNADGTISFNFIGINTISIPTFSPAPGVYSEPQSVTISCDTEGAAIYYTLDGSTPTVNSTQYTTPIQIESTTTIKAIAIADDEESVIAIGDYTIVSNIYRLVTSTDELEVGKNYLLVYEEGSVAYNGIETDKGIPGNVTIEGNEIDIINPDNHAKILVLENSDNGNWLIKDGDVYLALTSNKNTLNTQTSATATGTEWTISFVDNIARINNKKYTDYYLQYNAQSTGLMFRCYKGTQKYPSLYKQVEVTPQLMKGDVNGDGLVNIADVVAIVNYILGNPQEIFHFDAADMDDSGEVNITDAVALVSYLLEAEN